MRPCRQSRVPLTLRQADQARSDFAAIESDLQFIMGQDPLNGYKAEDKAGTFAEAAAWLRDQACTHYPDGEFAELHVNPAIPQPEIEG
jgi:hypothetical protein